jgi:CheY-like chemotaxis protein
MEVPWLVSCYFSQPVLDDILESLNLFDVDFDMDFEIESDDEIHLNTYLNTDLNTENELNDLDDLDSFLLIQEDNSDNSNDAKLPKPDLFVDIFSVPFTNQLLEDKSELIENNDEDIVASDNDFSNAWTDFPTTDPDVDTAIEVSPIYHHDNHHDNCHDDISGEDTDSGEDIDSRDIHLDSEVVSNDNAIHVSLQDRALQDIALQDLEILQDLSEELLMRKGGLDVYLSEMKVLSEEAQRNLQSLALNEISQDQSAIAVLQNTLESLTNILNHAEQQTYAMSQDVRHLKGSLHQVLNTRALMRVLLIDIDQMCLAIPSKVILEVLPIKLDEDLENRESMFWRDRLIPVVRLTSLLKLNCRHNLHQVYPQSHTQKSPSQRERHKPAHAVPSFLVIRYENDLFALQTDGCWSDQEATFHQIEGDITLPEIFEGVVILGNNQAIALLNPSELVSQCLRSQTKKSVLIEQAPQTPQASQTNLKDLNSLSDFFGSNELELTHKSTQDSPQSPHSRVPPKILIVESSANVRRYLAMTLTKSGFLTEQVQNGKEAIALLQERLSTKLDIDIVITDLEMPQMDGFKLLSDIRNHESFHSLPVVVLTSRNNENNQKLALELGANAYFSKPYQ